MVEQPRPIGSERKRQKTELSINTESTTQANDFILREVLLTIDNKNYCIILISSISAEGVTILNVGEVK